jgi:Spy/CpxP family protein refolding chaperone
MIFASLFIFSAAIIAQETAAPTAPQMIMRKEMRVEHHHGIVTPQMRADKMAKTLGLTDAEKSKVKELFEKQDAARIKMADEVYKIKQEMRVKFENARKANEADLEKIIGKDKFEKLQALKTEGKKKMEDHRGMMKKHSSTQNRTIIQKEENMEK